MPSGCTYGLGDSIGRVLSGLEGWTRLERFVHDLSELGTRLAGDRALSVHAHEGKRLDHKAGNGTEAPLTFAALLSCALSPQ